MFKVVIKHNNTNCIHLQKFVSVDSLPEVELMALDLARKHFHANNLILVYVDNLMYDIYEVGEPIGKLTVKTD